MASFQQTITDPPVCEKTTCQMVVQLTNEADEALTSGDVSACTLTLYHRPSGAIINSRSAQDIKNTNGGTISAAGVLTLILSNLDNALTSQVAASEVHVALIEYTWASGARYGKKEITFTVVNQHKVT